MKKGFIRACQIGFVVITFVLLLYRITLHADNMDEIMNLNIAYRIVLGDIPFYHIQETYQFGALFMVPFLWLFVKLTGGTTGIILYARVVYIVVLVICAIVTYRLLRNYMDKTNAFFLSYNVCFFELLSLFYLWYDSEAVVFCLLGNLAVITALERSKNVRQKNGYLILAGGFHLCMVIAHAALAPMAVGIAIVIAIVVYFYYEKKLLEALRCSFYYALIPLVIIVLGIAGVCLLGKLEVLWGYVAGLLNSRGVGTVDILSIIKSVYACYISVNGYFVKITAVLMLCYLLAWMIPKTFWIFAFGVIILPIYNQYLLPETSVRGLPNYLSYLALWAPFLYFLIRRKEKIDHSMFYIMWIPPLISVLFIPMFSLTGTYGPVKAWQMCLPSALVSMFFLYRIWKERIGEKTVVFCQSLYMLVSLTLLLNAYKYVYLNEPLISITGNIRLTEGIYSGIKVNSSMECMVDMQKMVEKYSEGCSTILASSEIRQIYLMTDLRPVTRTTEMATYFDGEIRRWNLQKEYFERFNQTPDIMFLEVYDLQDPYIENFLNANYKLIVRENIGSHTIHIYKKKELLK